MLGCAFGACRCLCHVIYYLVLARTKNSISRGRRLYHLFRLGNVRGCLADIAEVKVLLVSKEVADVLWQCAVVFFNGEEKHLREEQGVSRTVEFPCRLRFFT